MVTESPGHSNSCHHPGLLAFSIDKGKLQVIILNGFVCSACHIKVPVEHLLSKFFSLYSPWKLQMCELISQQVRLHECQVLKSLALSLGGEFRTHGDDFPISNDYGPAVPSICHIQLSLEAKPPEML